MILLVACLLNLVVYATAQPPPQFQCTDTGTKMSNPEDCTQYFECTNYGIFIPRQCAAGTGFNGFQCDHLQNLPNCSPGGDACDGYDVFPDPTDCTRYLQCVYGQFVSVSCFPGTGFNTAMDRCDHLVNLSNCPPGA